MKVRDGILRDGTLNEGKSKGTAEPSHNSALTDVQEQEKYPARSCKEKGPSAVAYLKNLHVVRGGHPHQAQAARQHKLGRKHELRGGACESCEVVGVYHAAIAIEGVGIAPPIPGQRTPAGAAHAAWRRLLRVPVSEIIRRSSAISAGCCKRSRLTSPGPTPSCLRRRFKMLGRARVGILDVVHPDSHPTAPAPSPGRRSWRCPATARPGSSGSRRRPPHPQPHARLLRHRCAFDMRTSSPPRITRTS